MEAESQTRERVLKTTLTEVRSSTEDTDDHSDPCVICLEAVSERAVARPCRHHSFDFLCLISWLQERTACPLCNSDVRSVEYDWRSADDFKTYIVPQRHIPRGSTASPYIRPNNRNHERPRAAPRRPRRPRPQVQPSNPDAALLRRRQVYRDQLYSLHVGSNGTSSFQDLNPQKFANSEELVSKARRWIRRELKVFEFLNADGPDEEGVRRRANNAEFLLEYIIAILKTVDIKGSGGQAEDMLQEFLGRDNTRLFLHELRAWLRSPYISLGAWDDNVQYNENGRALPGQKATIDSQLGENDLTSISNELERSRTPKRSRAASESDCCRSLTSGIGRKSKRSRDYAYVPYYTTYSKHS